MENFWKHTYFNTYYYSNIIDNVLTGQAELLGFVSDFLSENYSFVLPFSKQSTFHGFIQYIVSRFLDEEMNDHDQHAFRRYQLTGKLPALYAELLLKVYGIGYPFEAERADGGALSYSDIEEYQESILITGHQEELCEKIADEVFYILFNNRDLLIRISRLAAGYVLEMDKHSLDLLDAGEYWPLFSAPGRLRRVNIPQWCRQAVYFREKGRCCLCGSDLTTILRSAVRAHYDHMVPLYHGGLNDVSNIQLLCSVCNLKKGRKDIETSAFYFKWYQ